MQFNKTSIIVVLTICLSALSFSPVFAYNNALIWHDVKSFAYQLQDADLSKIRESSFDLVIIDYSQDGSDEQRYSRTDISSLQNSPSGSKLILSYMSIGEAENYRWYWDNDWDSDEDGTPDGSAPNWLGPSNPEWEGNYKVKYWDPEWKQIVFDYLDKILEVGYDGVYLDIIDAYEYWGPEGESGLNRQTAEQDMVDFVIEIAKYARENSTNPQFGVFPQNGEALSSHPEYIEAVSGIGREDVWYTDNDPNSSDEIEEAVSNLDVFNRNGKLVLVTDYVTEEGLIAEFYSDAVVKGYVPYAGVRDLDELNLRYPPMQADRPRGANSVVISNIDIKDSDGNEINKVPIDAELLLVATVSNNNKFENQSFTLVMQVTDQNGFTEEIWLQSGALLPDESIEVTFPWKPATIGTSIAKSFAISDLQTPEILSFPSQRAIIVTTA